MQISGPMYSTELPWKTPLGLITSTDTTLLLWKWNQGEKETASVASTSLKILPLFALLKGFSSKAKWSGWGRKKRKSKGRITQSLSSDSKSFQKFHSKPVISYLAAIAEGSSLHHPKAFSLINIPPKLDLSFLLLHVWHRMNWSSTSDTYLACSTV